MAKLEDLFRRSLSETPPPATPPPGQWERIRQGVVAPSAPPSPWWRFAAGVVVGMLLAGMGGWFVVVAPALRRPDVVPAVTPAEVERAVVDTVVRWRVDTVYVDRYASVANDQPPAWVARSRPLPLTWIAPRPLSAPMIADLAAPRSILTTATLWEGSINPVEWQYEFNHLNVLPVKAVEPQRSINTVPADGGWRYFTVVTPPQRPAGRWEFGVHLRPQLISGTRNVELLRADSTQGFDRGTYTVAGEEVDLYGIDGTQVSNPIRPRLLATHVQLARQFSSGLRIGLGLIVARASDGRPSRGVLDAEGAGAEYFLYQKTTKTEFQVLLSLGYTFRLRRRLQITPGLTLGPRYRANEVIYDYIFSTADNRHYRQDIFSSRRGVGISNFDILPQLSLHYHLNDRLSVGTEIVPGLGLGGRYKF